MLVGYPEFYDLNASVCIGLSRGDHQAIDTGIDLLDSVLATLFPAAAPLFPAAGSSAALFRAELIPAALFPAALPCCATLTCAYLRGREEACR